MFYFVSCRLSSLKCLLESSTHKHVFVKDIGFTMAKKDYGFIPEGYTHTFLIRHPLRVFVSYRKALVETILEREVIPGVTEMTFDIGHNYPSLVPPDVMFNDMYDLWKHVEENSMGNSIVIDGDDLLSNPAEILPKYCRSVGLPFTESMLKWDASTEVVNNWRLPAKGLTERFGHFLKRALKSSEFLPSNPMPDREHVTPDVIRCVDQNIEYYNEMYNARIKI